MGLKRTYAVIGACSGWGAQIRSCEEGPEDLVRSDIIHTLEEHGAAIAELTLLFPEQREKYKNIPLDQALPMIQQINGRIADTVQRAMRNGEFPIVLEGDHSNAVGVWNGVYQGLGRVPLGLLWIDAHMDAHTPQTSPSGAWHGMPIAALLGHGPKELCQLTQAAPILLPEHVALIGTRSAEAGERALLKRLNVRVFEIEEVRDRGLKEVVSEALAHVTRDVEGFGVSLDLDVLDPSAAPGVGSPVSGGLTLEDLLEALDLIAHQKKLRAFELSEYNPSRDPRHTTRACAFEILKKVIR